MQKSNAVTVIKSLLQNKINLGEKPLKFTVRGLLKTLARFCCDIVTRGPKPNNSAKPPNSHSPILDQRFDARALHRPAPKARQHPNNDSRWQQYRGKSPHKTILNATYTVTALAGNAVIAALVALAQRCVRVKYTKQNDYVRGNTPGPGPILSYCVQSGSYGLPHCSQYDAIRARSNISTTQSPVMSPSTEHPYIVKAV